MKLLPKAAYLEGRRRGVGPFSVLAKADLLQRCIRVWGFSFTDGWGQGIGNPWNPGISRTLLTQRFGEGLDLCAKGRRGRRGNPLVAQRLRGGGGVNLMRLKCTPGGALSLIARSLDRLIARSHFGYLPPPRRCYMGNTLMSR